MRHNTQLLTDAAGTRTRILIKRRKFAIYKANNINVVQQQTYKIYKILNITHTFKTRQKIRMYLIIRGRISVHVLSNTFPFVPSKKKHSTSVVYEILRGLSKEGSTRYHVSKLTHGSIIKTQNRVPIEYFFARPSLTESLFRELTNSDAI